MPFLEFSERRSLVSFNDCLTAFNGLCSASLKVESCVASVEGIVGKQVAGIVQETRNGGVMLRIKKTSFIQGAHRKLRRQVLRITAIITIHMTALCVKEFYFLQDPRAADARAGLFIFHHKELGFQAQGAGISLVLPFHADHQSGQAAASIFLFI